MENYSGWMLVQCKSRNYTRKIDNNIERYQQMRNKGGKQSYRDQEYFGGLFDKDNACDIENNIFANGVYSGSLSFLEECL